MQFEYRFDLVKVEDAPWFAERLAFHKLLPLTAWTWKNQGANPGAMAKVLEQTFMKGLALEKHCLDQSRRVFSTLHAESISFMPMKGPYWACQIYPDFTCRQAGDIDLLLHHENARRAIDLFKQNGYASHFIGSSESEDLELRGELAMNPGSSHPHDLPVEIHWSPLPAPRFKRMELLGAKDFFQDARPAAWQGINFVQPRPEIQFLYLVLHASCQHQFMRLMYVMDVIQCMRAFQPMDWTMIFSLARERGCSLPLYYTLKLSEALHPLPEAALCAMRYGRRPPTLRVLAGLTTLSSTLKGDAHRGSLRRKLFRLAASGGV